MKENKITSIVIADDHQLFADGLEYLLNMEKNYKVIEKVSNGRTLIQVLNKITPDLILLDLNMPFINGIDAATIIRQKNKNIKIVIISMFYDKDILYKSKAAGINGFLSKDIKAEELKLFLKRIVKGEIIFPSDKEIISKKINTYFLETYKLSDREVQIIRLIRQGFTSKEIADMLYLSELTIETHRKNIYRKLHIKSSTSLIEFAIKNNL